MCKKIQLVYSGKKQRGIITETKDKILKSAFKLFLKKGFTDVTINEIISKARITKGGFFYYFKSKDQLLFEVIDEYIFTITDSFTQKIQTLAGSSKDKLQLFFEALPGIEGELQKKLGDKRITYRAFYLLLMEGVKKFDFFNERITVYHDKLRQGIVKIINDGKKEGSIAKAVNTEIMAQHIIASSEGILLLWTVTDEIDLQMMSKEMFNNFWLFIKA
ncbi:MAG: TetR/AcrR family transcriptional regulator [Spirochaetes bacterium]|nr:TetR/AcrR family transcriptional regulator [Spirochaetota bacterium]